MKSIRDRSIFTDAAEAFIEHMGLSNNGTQEIVMIAALLANDRKTYAGSAIYVSLGDVMQAHDAYMVRLANYRLMMRALYDVWESEA